jgi:hypothetical protein
MSNAEIVDRLITLRMSLSRSALVLLETKTARQVTPASGPILVSYN